MESEKVKEIKKVLEEGQFNTINHHQKEGKPIKISFADILNLINELESEKNSVLSRNNELLKENERLSKELDSEWKDRRKAEEDLHKAQWNYKIGLGQSQSVNKKLKDRIAELEKKNAKLLDSVETVQKERCVFKCELTKKQLKQFAEKLKEKVKNFCGTEEENHYYDVSKEGACEEIDETLKEFIND